MGIQDRLQRELLLFIHLYVFQHDIRSVVSRDQIEN